MNTYERIYKILTEAGSQGDAMTAHSKRARARNLRASQGATDAEISGKVWTHKSGVKLTHDKGRIKKAAPTPK